MYKPLRQAVKPLFPYAHRLLAKRHPKALWEGDATQDGFALTFDDGPCSRDTVPLLRVLAKYGVVATFFVLGDRLRGETAATVREIHAAGHQVAIHGYHHRPFLFASTASLRRKLDMTRDLIAATCGIRGGYGV